MREVFIKIVEEYTQEKTKPIKQNELFQYITNQAKQEIVQTAKVSEQSYKIQSSAGKGQWAIIPWIAIFDKDITTTAEYGYYIVYLFSADMKKIYLSLNQGWTYFKEQYKVKQAKDKIKKVSQMWKNKLKSGLNDFSYAPIDMRYNGSGSTLPKGYELGHICGKEYDSNTIPPEEELIQDLQKMISLYRELKGHMVENNVVHTNNHLISLYVNEQAEDKEEEKSQETKELDQIIADEGAGSSLIITQKILNKREKNLREENTTYQRGSNNSTNYDQKNKRQATIGRAGEFIVLEEEKQKLERLGIKKEVEHVARTTNDTAGYDIKSYDENGNEMYIEVKTTKENENQPFFVTKKEVQFSRDNKDNYYLYRLYNLKPKEKKAECYRTQGDITKIFDLEPEIYKVVGRKEGE